MTAAPTGAVLAGAGHALPAPMDQQALWDGFFRDHYADARIARKVWQSAAIRTRRGVVDPTQEDVSGLGPPRGCSASSPRRCRSARRP
jgi:hypothetical protein